MDGRRVGIALMMAWTVAACPVAGVTQPTGSHELPAVTTQREIGRLRDEGDVWALVHFLTSTDAGAVAAAARAIGSCGDETVLPVIESPDVATRISDPRQRQWAIAACAVAARRVAARTRGADDTSTVLAIVRGTGNAGERLEATVILYESGALGPEHAEAALDAARGAWLDDDGTDGRTRALFLLAAAKTESPDLLPLLRRTVEGVGDGGRPLFTDLVEAYWDLRLQGLDESERVALLVAALADDPVMRPAWVLRSYKDAAAAPLAAFIADPDRTDSALLGALWALEQIPAPSAGEALAAILRDDGRPDGLRMRAALALATSGAPESTEWLLQGLDAADAGPMAIAGTLTALARLGAREHGARVAEFLDHDDAALRRTAAETLRTMGARDQYEAVRRRLEVETDEQVRYALEQALNALQEDPDEP